MRFERPKVSVLLPVRQWSVNAERAIQSILHQTERSLELLVLGHEDVQQWANRGLHDDRIRWIKRRSPGIVGALNTGLADANGDFIARMDADDWAYPERLSCQLNYLVSYPDVQLCGTRIRFTTLNDTPVPGGYAQYQRWLNGLIKPADIALHCFVESPMPHPTWLAHRSVWEKLGFYRQFDGPEDYDLVLTAHALDLQMGKPEPVLQDWLLHEQRLTITDERYRQAAFIQLKADALLRQDWPFANRHGLPDSRAIWLCGTGETAAMWHCALESKGVFIAGFADLNVAGSGQLHRGLPVAAYHQLFAIKDDVLLITAIAHPEVRQQFIKEFSKNGLMPGADFVLGA